MPFYGYLYNENIFFTINVYDEEPYSWMPKDLIKEENRLYAEYVTSNYEIIETEDINNNKCETKVKLLKQIHYFLIKEVIINMINYYMFFRDRYILYKEFTGIQKLWNAYGQLKKHFFHINGKIFGEYKEYFDNGNLCIDCVYVDNKIEGEYKIFDCNGNLKVILYFVNGKKVDK
jgi:antitoxin component YwqK of YwqJK toxin-antitoxin module